MQTLPPIQIRLFVLMLSLSPVLTGQAVDARIGSGKTAEQDPVLAPGGNVLFFTRPDHRNNQGRDDAPDVWMRTRKPDGSWNRAINPGPPINTYAADRALGFNPDGSRLAVLRDDGQERYIDVLQRQGRKWTQVARTQVPSSVERSQDLGYNLVTGDLIYAAGDRPGTTNLYLLTPTVDGGWNDPVALTEANTDADETRPFFAPDGRTLYFFRSGAGWFRQRDRGAEVALTRISILSQGFAVHLNAQLRNAPTVVGLGGTGRGLNPELRGMLLTDRDQPRPGRIVTPSTPAAAYDLTSGVSIKPQRIPGGVVLYLRDDERLVNGEELSDLDRVDVAIGGMRSQSAPELTTARDELSELEYDILRYENYLATLDRERQRIVDLSEQRRFEQRTSDQRPPLDTLPTGSRRSSDDRYADELDELEAMKEKFRRQQEDRQAARDGAPVEFNSRRANREATNYPSIADSYTPPPPPLSSRLARERRLRDSLDRASRIRNGLATPNPPPGTDQTWERELTRGLPDNRSDRNDPMATIRQIDEEYARQYAELERLKQELTRLRQERAAGSTPRNLQAKSPYPSTPYEPAPDAAPRSYDPSINAGTAPPTPYGSSPPADYPATVSPAPRRGNRNPEAIDRPLALATDAISFIPNTAYPDGAGYGGLDQLLVHIKRTKGTVDVYVHTSIDLPRRAAQLLSEERATTIREYLSEQGVAERHFRVVGYGNNLTGVGGERVEVY